ncbi:hypothetical protein [Paracoccus siganidrum]|uniref:hypothetical protein n=2 Tax=Paracoccus siganidrum TaxID=1276757 RepID=UPI001F0BD178|nr:hypothetical protein [Paracoccus siganidrum]
MKTLGDAPADSAPAEPTPEDAPQPRAGGAKAAAAGAGAAARRQGAGGGGARKGAGAGAARRGIGAGGKGKAARAGALPKPRRTPPQGPVRPAATPAKFELRHLGIALSFLLVVAIPVVVSAWYLWAKANDQYASYLGFSVRSESSPASSELLGGLSTLVGMTSSSSTDTDILYKFIQSHDLVERVNQRMDLAEIWSKAEGDPVFAYRGGGSMEDLLNEWERKVRVYYDDGMIDLRVLAFTPEDSHAIAQAILDESTIRINELNDVAREDALRYARQELDQAIERLKEARQAMTEFRNRHQLVDPTADVQGQVGVVTSLQQQLAEQLVALGMLRANAQANDPRIEQGELRISVIREQIDAERLKFGSETPTGEALSEVVGQYESLAVDRQFAESSYTAALAAYDAARAEAVRQSRYLAAYVRPTFAQIAEYPQRMKLMAILSGFLLVVWTIGVLIFYSLRDRR